MMNANSCTRLALVQLQVLEEMDAVHHEYDPVDGQGDLLIGIRR
jgi:hypothetical protein